MQAGRSNPLENQSERVSKCVLVIGCHRALVLVTVAVAVAVAVAVDDGVVGCGGRSCGGRVVAIAAAADALQQLRLRCHNRGCGG